MIRYFFCLIVIGLMGMGVCEYLGCAGVPYPSIDRLTDDQLLQRYREVEFWISYWRDDMDDGDEYFSVPESTLTSEDIYAKTFTFFPDFRPKLMQDLLQEKTSLLAEIRNRQLEIEAIP